ncbi:carotenoid ester lipase [Coprinopsis cinerea okayama7|uniref:Carboxylic ester hydrolase n=1 Tax=Coprinopsis cinerea (strain Okayama-7 / 130 / ATCC MYA-4618 / FGSC 9003) TaxID=240176 RepID=A8N3L7_COPC7|nr:carotenoid ester lipase [Coprinopsis cinerea okayama7\|eukprot:XP_001829457.2 carotenoid ester lipase [Coprinopsis cinerea okayama7\
MRLLSFSLTSLSFLALAVAQAPTVTLDQINVTGVRNDTVDKFLGIPYAQVPIGDLRFRLPVNISSYNQSFDASSYGYTCINQNSSSSTSLVSVVASIAGDIIGDDDPTTPQSEDCLTVNVIRPNADTNSSHPVLVWIYGGGFEGGSTIGYDDLTTTLVQRSVAIGKPIVLVSMNYRMNAFGFIASQEVQNEGVGNIGLHDQREALRWVKRYIGAFGGNSSHVTLWGQSAGAISASLQMVAYDGRDEDLFHAAFMQSGSPIPVGNITGGQIYYNDLVNRTGCYGQDDTLSCLRSAPLANLTDAINQSPGLFAYQSLALAWSPRADGTFLTAHPQHLVQQDKVLHIPMVSGDVDDEGTVFAQSTKNITTDEEFRSYVSDLWLPGASDEDLEPLWGAYPSDPADGSPFNTSFVSAITPQYKRMAAFQGDAVFQAPRRYFLQEQAGKQPIWSYLSRRLKYLPILGSFHASDLYLDLLNDYVIQFANNYDPNLDDSFNGDDDDDNDRPNWPQYTADSPALYTFPSTDFGDIEITQDTYREGPMRVLTNLSMRFPL